jgi:cytochrome c oxidase cbb3-type subunit 3
MIGRLSAAGLCASLAILQGGCAKGWPGDDSARGAADDRNEVRADVVSGHMPGVSYPVGPLPGPGETVAAANPLGDDAEAREQGRRLFVHFNCSGCHGGHAGGGMGPSLRDAAWIYGNKDSDIYDSIVEGRAHGMPSWGPLLPSEQIWQIVAYIQTLETPQEAEPPT